MSPKDFSDMAPGRLVRASEGFWTYVPNPLPPPLDPSWEITRRLSEADRALAQLAGTGAMLPNPHLLIDPFLRREAALSSRIEGTTATVRQLVLFEATNVRHTNDEPEVHNYVLAMELGLDLLKHLPVSLRLIREVHAQLLQGTRGAETQPGQFRRQQNMIADARNQSVVDARFVPPPVPEMLHALHELEHYIHASFDLPPLIRIALIHYQFEAIHPFMDGNGRLGRLLITLLLCAEGHLPQPLLYLSAYFERHRDAYLDYLLQVSRRGAWVDWVIFFLQGVAEQASDAVRRARLLLDLQVGYRQRLQKPYSSSLPLQLADALFTNPAITVSMATRALAVTPRAARQNIEKLLAVGILREYPQSSRPRVYICEEIMSIIEAGEV